MRYRKNYADTDVAQIGKFLIANDGILFNLYQKQFMIGIREVMIILLRHGSDGSD